MRLNDIQVAGLQSLVSILPADPVGMLPEVQAAYTLGQVVGQAKLARELLQAEEDKLGHPRGHLSGGKRGQ